LDELLCGAFIARHRKLTRHTDTQIVQQIIRYIHRVAANVLMLIAESCRNDGNDSLQVKVSASTRKVPEAKNRIAANVEVFVRGQREAYAPRPCAVGWVHGDHDRYIEQLIGQPAGKYSFNVLLCPSFLEWPHWAT